MKFSMILWVGAAVVSVTAVPAQTTIRHVPSQHATIPAAVAVSVANDTVLVAAGNYNGLISVFTPLTILSESGPDVTRLQNSGDVLFLHDIHPGTFHLVGFEVLSTDGRGIASDFSNFEVADCIFSHAQTAAIHFSGYSGTVRNSRFYDVVLPHSAYLASVYVDNLGHTKLERNVFYGLSHQYVFFTTAERVDLVNNTIVGCNGGFNIGNSYGSPGTVYNNIFSDVAGTAIVTNSMVGPAIDYNLYFSNGTDVTGGSAGVNSLYADPLLTSTASGDFTPLPGSPVIDAGNPDPLYNDPDGSRNDIGANLGQSGFPHIGYLSVDGEERFHVVSNTPTIVWAYRDTLAAQSAFEIEVGTDNDWGAAEMWSSGEINSPDTSVTYAGSTLYDGGYYHVRVRVTNGVNWSNWRYGSFRLNSQPTIPLPLRPIGGAETHALGTSLGVANSVDNESDSIFYEFEVYSDAGLGGLVISITTPATTPDSTFTPLLDSLQPELDYWWRARGFDGWENSSWTATQQFHARGSQVLAVPGDFATIPAAIVAAADYDTVLVFPGSYAVSIDLQVKQLCLIGVGGAASTILVTDSSGMPIIRIPSISTNRTQISGFTIVAPSLVPGVQITGGSPVIRDNVFRDAPTPYGPAALTVENGNPLIERNLFLHNKTVAALGVYGGTARIINNTFSGNLRGFFTLTGQGVALNNIVVNSAEYGVYGSFSLLDYNDVWMNNPDYVSSTPHPNDIAAAPLFLDTLTDSYGLMPTSPCINAGDPGVEHYDPDGTRNDIGAYPFQGPFPVALSISVYAEDQFHVVGDTPRFRWTFYDTLGSQSGYEIEVGSNGDWSTAESWYSGQVNSAANIAQYAGLPLADGFSYSLRLRLNNGSTWGAWAFYTFRMNSLPSTPVPVIPVTDDTLHHQAVRSVFDNSTDAQGDSLSYEVELFDDSALSNLIAAEAPLPGYAQTSTHIWPGLQAQTRYWWRARAFDQWEYSEWSVAQGFFARGPGVVRVPQFASTISEGIGLAGPNDTVMVGPGEYYTNLNLLGKIVHLISSGGPAVTTLHPLEQDQPHIVLGSPSADSVEIAGFTFVGGEAGSMIPLTGGAPRIHHNVFREFDGQPNPSMVLHVVGGGPIITHNVFFGNDGVSSIGIYGGDATVINNTFDRNNGGLHLIGGSATVLNNIVTGSSGFGLYGLLTNADYNCLYGNFPNHDQYGGGPNDIIQSPVYYDAVGGDFRLQTSSPCINAGHPGAQYNDSDGSRNDMGAFASVCACGCHADPVCDHQTDILDVAFVIAGAFRGLAEIDDAFCFAHGETVAGRTDLNCSGATDVVDVVRVIDVAFRGADPAVAFCTLCSAP